MSGQIIIFHQPELRPFGDDFPIKTMIPVRENSEVVIIYPFPLCRESVARLHYNLPRFVTRKNIDLGLSENVGYIPNEIAI